MEKPWARENDLPIFRTPCGVNFHVNFQSGNSDSIRWACLKIGVTVTTRMELCSMGKHVIHHKNVWGFPWLCVCYPYIVQKPTWYWMHCWLRFMKHTRLTIAIHRLVIKHDNEKILPHDFPIEASSNSSGMSQLAMVDNRRVYVNHPIWSHMKIHIQIHFKYYNY